MEVGPATNGRRRAVRMMALVVSAVLTAVLAGCGPAPAAPKAPQAAPAAPKAPQAAPAAPKAPQPIPKTYAGPPKMAINPQQSYRAVFKTNLGDFTVDLLAKSAPQTVNNFVFLARDGYYNGVRFHRIMADFMIQTGDPTGTGAGGPGYTIPDELPPPYPYDPGIVAMANTGQPNSGGGQFFICTGPRCRNLDQLPNYTQFGRVSAGMDVVQKIAAVPVGPSARGELSVPKEEVYIIGIDVTEGK